VYPQNRDVYTPAFNSFVALGDSLLTTPHAGSIADATTFGPGSAPQGGGWADRLSVILAGHARLSGGPFDSVDLTGPGATTTDVVSAQSGHTVRVRAELATVILGPLEVTRPDIEPDELAEQLESALGELRRQGAHVLVASCFDPASSPLLKPLRPRAAALNAHVWRIARTTGCTVLDLWSVRELQQPALWSADRSALTAPGHRLIAVRAAHTLRIPYAESAERPYTPAGAGDPSGVGGHQ
jgi:hypothetical protein